MWEHDKHCLTAALKDALDNLRDSTISPTIERFRYHVAEGVPLTWADSYLLDGTKTCTCRVRTITDGLWLCQDCTMLVANATLGSEDEQEDAAHADRMVEHLERYQPEMRPGRYAAASLVLAEKHVDHATRQCDGCGDHLHGYRHEAALIC